MKEINERPLCHRGEDLVAYLYNETSDAESKDFADHAERCDACRSELALFRQMHESISLWREETLGSFSPVEIAPRLTESQKQSEGVYAERKLSAFESLRQFFTISPVWLRGATAFAAMLLFGLLIVMATRIGKQPAPVARNSPEFKAAVKEEVNKQLAQQQPATVETPPEALVKAPKEVAPKTDQNPSRETVGRVMTRHNYRPTRLTAAEREQLAADLRLIPSKEDEDLPFGISDEPNE